jgi:hypothetical protein
VRKLLMLATVLGVALFGFSTVQAAVFYFAPLQPDLRDLDHRYNKAWGIDWSAHSGETIVSATLTISNIWDWTVEDDVLFIHLLNDPALGIVTSWDGEAGGDHFEGMGLLLSAWSDPVGGYPTGTDLTITLNAEQLALLNTYAADGLFGFGFDADCHYYNDGIRFEIVTATIPTPEPTALAVFTMGLAGLGLIRRRK